MDAGEAEFMKSIYTGRSAELENTVFTVLDPDGKTPLVRPSRSPSMSYGSVERLMEALEEFSSRYPRASERKQRSAPLPVYEDLRVSLDVASCDSRPLVVIWSADEAERAKAAKRLAKLAWSEEFVGRCHYAFASEASELESIEGVPEGGGLLVVAPGTFGLTGKVLASGDLDAKDAAWSEQLERGLDLYAPVAKVPRDHVRQGRRSGKEWETDIPVTDGRKRGGRGGR